MMKRVLLDVDGVIANFIEQYLLLAQNKFGKVFKQSDIVNYQGNTGKALGFTQEEIDAIFTDLCRPDIAYIMNGYEGAIDGVSRLIEKFDVWFLTSPLRGSATWCHDRDRWLLKHFGKDQASKVIYAKHKWPVHGDVFVDDKPSNVEKWQAAWPKNKALLWIREHNKSAVCEQERCHTWEQLESIIDNL